MNSLNCPITKKRFQDPVIGADGRTYERTAIIDWLKKYGISPSTKKPMDAQSLKTNRIVTKILNELSTISKSSLSHCQFELDVDIRMRTERPLFESSDKVIYEVEWIGRQGPQIILLEIKGPAAIHEASFCVHFSCHPHIVRTFGFVKTDSERLMLLQEYAPAGDLSELLREHGFRPSEDVLVEMFVQICDAMICLADNSIVHGDLGCRNVLVFRSHAIEPKENLVKLTDFGLTRGNTIYSMRDNIAASTRINVPIRYAAPEILHTRDTTYYSEKSDVYSMGVLIWEALSIGKIPYSPIERDDDVRNRKLNNEKLSQPSCSKELWTIMENCWRQQPTDRPDFRSLKQSLLILQFRTTPKEKESIVHDISNRLNLTTINDQNTTTIRPNLNNRNGVNSCSFCNENFVTTETMSTHLIICGNKTDRCPDCGQFVRRAIYIYHRDNRCIDPEESDVSASRTTSASHRPSFSRINEPKFAPSISTRMPDSNAKDDSTFGSRRNNILYASMKTKPKKSRSTIECEFCQCQYERIEYPEHREKCFRRPTNVGSILQRISSISTQRSGQNSVQTKSSGATNTDRNHSANRRSTHLKNIPESDSSSDD